MNVFEQHESEVRSYCRAFPVIFDRAQGVYLYDTDGKAYLDFLAGAGTLNYGHNNPIIKQALLDYIAADGITHGLDMYTKAKERFLTALNRYILKPRGMDYVCMFTGPTGTNAVEAALKLARKIKGRTDILSFTNGFHGCTLGALAVTGNSRKRLAAGLPSQGVQRLPYSGYFGKDADTLAMMDKLLSDPSSGFDLPAAVIFEPIQGEGGLNAASSEWMQGLAALCKKHEILLIADNIQCGNGRSGQFFSFEEAGIEPDIITCSKSLSGYGLPFAITLIKPDLDEWTPGEHNGTFRGNNHAFVTAAKTFETYWADDHFALDVQRKSELLRLRLEAIAAHFNDPELIFAKGRGFMRGLQIKNGALAAQITERCFERQLIIETSGSEDQVVKCLIPLIISDEDLHKGLDILEQATREILTAHLQPSLGGAA